MSWQAIQEAVDTFFYRDPREKENKPFFPQPEELIDVAKAEQDSMIWRAQYAAKLKSESVRLASAPPAIEQVVQPHPWNDLTKEQVCLAIKGVLKGLSPEQARDEVLASQ